ncbi:hypothetical protein Bca4012_046874 [Brassica carinata]
MANIFVLGLGEDTSLVIPLPSSSPSPSPELHPTSPSSIPTWLGRFPPCSSSRSSFSIGGESLDSSVSPVLILGVHVFHCQLESFLRTTTSSTLEKYCHCVVNRLIQLNLEAHMFTVFHHSRFNDEFGWNNDDTFVLGIKHTRKSIRLYNDFITSDMIIASPLGLQLALGKEEDKKRLSCPPMDEAKVRQNQR